MADQKALEAAETSKAQAAATRAEMEKAEAEAEAQRVKVAAQEHEEEQARQRAVVERARGAAKTAEKAAAVKAKAAEDAAKIVMAHAADLETAEKAVAAAPEGEAKTAAIAAAVAAKERHEAAAAKHETKSADSAKAAAAHAAAHARADQLVAGGSEEAAAKDIIHDLGNGYVLVGGASKPEHAAGTEAATAAAAGATTTAVAEKPPRQSLFSGTAAGLAALTAVQKISPKKRGDILVRMFNEFDNDDSQQIDTQELGIMLNRLTRHAGAGGTALFDESEVSRVMEAFDEDKSNTIDVDEWTQWILHGISKLKMQESRDEFAAVTAGDFASKLIDLLTAVEIQMAKYDSDGAFDM